MSVILVNLTDTFDEWRKKTNDLSIGIGDVTRLDSDEPSLVRAINENYRHIGNVAVLTTDDNGNLVGAINEVDYNTDINTINIGDLTTLDTADKSNLVGAINENVSHIGNLTILKTAEKTNLVGAINEVYDDIQDILTTIGDMTSLTTDNKTTLVGAINELDAHTDANANSIYDIRVLIGDLTLLVTTDKSSVVNAINEVKTQAVSNSNHIGDMNLNTNANNLTDAINELYGGNTNIGDLADLTTDEKGSIVGAINEVDNHADVNAGNIGDLNDLETDNKDNLVKAINEAMEMSMAFAITLG